ncbi:type II toxin-antitoxin system VapB family antitoxin [Pontixanthobacter sp.]|uniref:type II toxin-antitoxin system VapB family antitoxin n=1 Tax=Pontixanthobacter sp. TaxID=2792078 RepID=UPI003C7D9ABA
MRTNVVIDDALMADALKASGLNTKKAVIEEALRKLVLLRKQANMRQLRGKLVWDDDLDSMHQD